MIKKSLMFVFKQIISKVCFLTSLVLVLLGVKIITGWVDHTVDYHIDSRDGNERQEKEDARNESRDGGTSMYQDKDDPSKDEVYHDGKSVS